jgi:hypothetical protein
MDNKPKPIGWVTTISTLITEILFAWKSVMTIENSPLRKLDPRVAHMIFQCLAFIWSGIFAAMLGSYIAFGVSASIHILFLAGVFITAMTMNEADKRPQTFNRIGGYNGRGNGGEHE